MALVAEARSRGMEVVICALTVNAAVAEMVLRRQRPVVMLTSDIDDMAKLCGERVRLVSV